MMKNENINKRSPKQPLQSPSSCPLALGLALLIGLTGCTGLEGLFYQSQRESMPGQIVGTNTVFRTNLVVVTSAKTNLATGEITPPQLSQVIVPEITYEYAPPVVRTNLTPRPEFQALLEGARLLPFPFAGTAAMALGWLYSAYAALRNRRVARALVLGIESGRRFLLETPEGQRLDARIKDALVKHQELTGALQETRRLVERYTGPTHPNT